jgi:hypothetical protein
VNKTSQFNEVHGGSHVRFAGRRRLNCHGRGSSSVEATLATAMAAGPRVF